MTRGTAAFWDAPAVPRPRGTGRGRSALVRSRLTQGYGSATLGAPTGTSGTHELLTHVLVSTDQHLRERAQSNHWLRE